jgi:glycosyltransferase involved in cell wall biosynthesis
MVVAYYREQLLPPSETFIAQPARHLQRYLPIFCGVERVPGLDLPSERTFVLDAGSLAGRLRRKALRDHARAPYLVRALRRAGAHVLHAHFGPDGLQALPLAQRCGIPLVTTYHGYDVTWSDAALAASNPTRARYVERRGELIAGARLHLPVSDHLRKRLLALGFPSERVVVHHIGVDCETLVPAPEEERDELVLFVGRFVEKKGPDHFVRAAAICRREHPRARFAMVGDGPLRAQTERLAGELGTEVTFHGWQPPDVVRQLMGRARILCVPSVVAANGDSEGLPTAICEAGALGTPSVGYAHSGIPEVVEHGRTGLVVPEGAVEELGHAVAGVLADTDRWRGFSAAARARVEQHFNVRVQTDRLEHIYDEITERP